MNFSKAPESHKERSGRKRCPKTQIAEGLNTHRRAVHGGLAFGRSTLDEGDRGAEVRLCRGRTAFSPTRQGAEASLGLEYVIASLDDGGVGTETRFCRGRGGRLGAPASLRFVPVEELHPKTIQGIAITIEKAIIV